MSDDGIRSIVLSYSDVVIGGESIDTVNAVLDVLEKGCKYLKRWTITFEKRYPEQEHDIPLERNITMIFFRKC